MKGHGLLICQHGVALHSERRRRAVLPSREAWRRLLGRAERGEWKRVRRVRAFSEPSRRGLEFIATNVAVRFRLLLTLTYQAEVEGWEDDAARNARIALRSKCDLNRFLSSLRRDLGAYLWVQEFQRRGVIHYHVLCEREVWAERVSVAWCRAPALSMTRTLFGTLRRSR